MFSRSATKVGLKILYRNRVFLAVVLLFLSSAIIYIQYNKYYSVHKIDINKFNEQNLNLHDEKIDKKNENNNEINNNIDNQIEINNKKTIKLDIINNIIPNQQQNIINNLVEQHKKQQELQQTQAPVEDKNAKMVQMLSKLERIIHIDLKGAPPKPNYFKEFIPLIKKYGATGILIEYEDMFPFKGRLEPVKHGNAYSEDDIKLILKLAKDNNLTIMPLVQTYGHLEWLLKHKNFAHLRENYEFPQVISPCIDETYDVLFDMLDQVISLHPNDLQYFHIGCDEVYYKLENEKCRSPEMKFNGDFTTAFMSHVVKIGEHIRKKLPHARIIIWDDMMHGMNDDTINKYKPSIEKLEIEPMIWAYMENVMTWYQPGFFNRFGRHFKNVWAASAYKGASGELATITSIQHHYLNHITWNQQIYTQMSQGACNFRGIALTGWSRYDHFLQLCDLLPEAIPSLIFNLKTVQLGEINQEMRTNISRELGCQQNIPWTPEEVYDGFIQCAFPGHEVYEAILPINGIFRNLEENMAFAKKYMSPISIKYNYAHKARAKEVMDRLQYTYSSMLRFKKNFIQACSNMYWEETAHEWLEVYFLPEFDALHDYMKSIRHAMKEKHWNPRPVPVTIRNHPDNI